MDDYRNPHNQWHQSIGLGQNATLSEVNHAMRAISGELRRRYTQDYAKRFESENNNSAYEMTAADLGLPLHQWSYTWLERAYGLDWRALSAAAALDAPYSFWLGADHG